MRYHTTSALSENIRITPEGYLLCLDVPVARTGVMHYLPEELPEEIAAHATEETVLVYRLPEDVFARDRSVVRGQARDRRPPRRLM
jgi:hypothetical protein